MQNFTIIGDGGIGSNLSDKLVKLLAFYRKKEIIKEDISITVCDGDVVNKSNLLRQHFYPEDEGSKKTDITTLHLQSLANDICNNILVKSFPYYVKEENINKVIADGSIVLVGVDNYITRQLIEDYSQKLEKVLVIFGGNDYDDGDVNILLKEEGKYLTPLLTEKHPEIVEKKDKFPDEMSCEEASVSTPQLILANIRVADYMLEAVNTYITKGTINWHEKFFDLKTGNERMITDGLFKPKV